MKKKKEFFAYSDGFVGLSVSEIFDRQSTIRKEKKKDRKNHTFEKEGLTSRESRVSVECPCCQCRDCSRYGKTRQGIQRFRCLKCGKIYGVSDGRNLHSSKLTSDELLDLAKCIYLGLPVQSACIITGLSVKTVLLWQKRAFSVAEEWVNGAKFHGKTWIDEVYFNFANGTATAMGENQCKKAGLSFSNVCVCIGYDECGMMFARAVKAGKVDEISIECCFSGRMDGVSVLVHDAEKSHGRLVRKEKLILMLM